MPTCKICLKKFKTLRFQSARVCVCGRCTNDLNSYKEVAEYSYQAARELLIRGMLRRATIEVSSSAIPLWKRQRAEDVLGNLHAEVDRALPKWIQKLVADDANREKLYKIIRAHRRGLLHFDRPHRWGYPNNWKEVAHEIRRLDNFSCVLCSETEAQLHVHHIVYASNFGTHQKTNLVTLCRFCHEKEHERIFDLGENMLSSDEMPET
jgi:5-methylcytosine-specific restriction endonuclease McrA